MAYIIPDMYSVAIGSIMFYDNNRHRGRNFHEVLELVLEIFTKFLYLKFSQSTCLNFQQKYLYLTKLKVLVLVHKYIADVLDPSLQASIVICMSMASIIVASHSQR